MTGAQNQALQIWGQNVIQQIQGAAGATGVNIIPQQYALLAGSALPPTASLSNCSVTLDTGSALFGAGSYKISITGSPATVKFSADTAWPLHPGWQWIASFFQKASVGGLAGQLVITTPTKAYSTAFSTTTAWDRLFDTLNLGADTSTSFGLSFTFTGASGATVWLAGLQMEPFFNTPMGPSPFISTSPALTLDNQPDGSGRFAVTNAPNLNGVSEVDGSNRASGYLGGFDPRGSWAPLIGNPNFAYTSTPTSITITWSSFTLYRPDGTTSTIPANTGSGFQVTGLGASTTYRFYPYINESTLTVNFVTGGDGQGTPAGAYPQIDMNAAAATTANGHMTLQSFTVNTPSSGTGGGGGGTGGFLGYCLTGEMWLDRELQAKYAHAGDLVYVASEDKNEQRPEIRHIREVSLAVEVCYRLVTESGAAVCASALTPMTLRNGSSVSFCEMDGREARVLRDLKASWERVIRLEALGARPVVRLSLGGRCFFAGEDPKSLIATHNYAKP